MARRESDLPAGTAFPGSERYWEERYRNGGDSGAGSYGKLALFKAEVLNAIFRAARASSAIEFGCGDGNQLSLLEIPSYVGLDVSGTAVETCRRKFAGDATRRFYVMRDYRGEQADVSLSLDVIFHLVEDDVFARYMDDLIGAARRLVVIYSSDPAADQITRDAHVKHRAVTRWIEQHHPELQPLGVIPNQYPCDGDRSEGSFSDFLVYGKRTRAP